MTRRQPAPAEAGLSEGHAARFDDTFRPLMQRRDSREARHGESEAVYGLFLRWQCDGTWKQILQ